MRSVRPVVSARTTVSSRARIWRVRVGWVRDRMGRLMDMPRTERGLRAAWRAVRRRGGGELARSSVKRFREADGTNHVRALAYQSMFVLLSGFIGLVGLASALDVPRVRGIVEQMVDTLSPGPSGQLLREAARQGANGGNTAMVLEIGIDRGASAGVTLGDYFAVVPVPEVVTDLGGDILGSIAEEVSLIQVVKVQEKLSVCQLSDWNYEPYFKKVGEAVEQFADAEGNVDLERLAEHVDVFWPIRKGQLVMRIPPAERTGRQEIEEAYGRTLDETISDEDRRLLYQDMVRKANAFLLEYGTGFFASHVLFQRGYAQFQLGEHRDAIENFELFLKRYPSSVSAHGARDWIDQSREALKKSVPETRQEVTALTTAALECLDRLERIKIAAGQSDEKQLDNEFWFFGPSVDRYRDAIVHSPGDRPSHWPIYERVREILFSHDVSSIDGVAGKLRRVTGIET
jgi:tetratricopeptide (TPR) repeat protein